jgi:hypothetical protein
MPTDPGDILLKDDSAFGHAYREMRGVVDRFQGGMETTAQSSASPAAAGKMEEGKAFMQQERQARELLVQYMTKTSDGLVGYQTAVEAIGSEYLKLAALNTQRLRTLMHPSEGAIPNNPVFNWEPIVANQIATQNGGN